MSTAPMPRAYEQAKTVAVEEIPIIDFAPFLSGSEADRSAVAARIGEACETVGFFYLANHGVPQDLIDGAFAASKSFFDQPVETRRKAAATLEHWRGYVPSKLEGEGGTVGGAIETFRFMLDLDPADPDVLAGKPLHLPNRWPEGLPGFKPAVCRLFRRGDDAVGEPACRLRPRARPARGLLRAALHEAARATVAAALPPAGLPAEEDFEIGAGEHRDTGAFTLLMQDDTGGLEVQRKTGEWIGAPPVPGTYVINIGDVMMKWTNGRFVSTPHRVVNRATKPRYSVPFFANPTTTR